MNENVSTKYADETLEFVKTHEYFLRLILGSFFVEHIKDACELVKFLKHC